MDILSGKAITAIKRKVNDLITGYNTNVTNIAAINAGNIGEIVAGAGTNQATAAILSATTFIHRITGANGTVAVKLPTGVVGMTHIVLNTVNAVLNIYPSSGEEINNGGADVVFSGTALYGYIFTYESAGNGWKPAAFLLVANGA